MGKVLNHLLAGVHTPLTGGWKDQVSWAWTTFHGEKPRSPRVTHQLNNCHLGMIQQSRPNRMDHLKMFIVNLGKMAKTFFKEA